MAAKLDAEDIAYWYLRLNGFLILRNFLVHGDRRGETRTDIDVLGVRFRYRREHLDQPMKDDDWIAQTNRTIVVFCEAKKRADDFNPAWTKRDKMTMESFLALVGVIPRKLWPHVANELYEAGRSEVNQEALITTLLINHDPERRVSTRLKLAQHIQLEHALRFIHRRFKKYHSVKTPHGQWEPSGHAIWNLYSSFRSSEDRFVNLVMDRIGIPQTRSADLNTLHPSDHREAVDKIG
ncbi:MAG: hypothetical protein C5B58_05030 [Acidobacteria bacterium]|nr:MAG: hypothetical protein C5B58_05030 [Acidobacteriota bacterium]